MHSAIRLSSVLNRVSELFEEKISPHSLWIRAEISSVKNHGNGHLYLEFIEHSGAEIRARCRATLWSSRLQALKLKHGKAFDEVFREGREIVCQVHVVFHPVHGISLNISDIDPDFTIGEIERRRRECLQRLHSEGLLDINRRLPVPIAIRHIALIAAPGSAGYADVTEQLLRNQYGYHFDIVHFPSTVQGPQAVPELLAALSKVDPKLFDVLVVVRGGGAAIDLDVFNHYELNAAMAQAGLPIIAGIGHEIDRTVLDEVAAIHVKTPSAAGAWIVERNRNFEVSVQSTFREIIETARQFLERRKAEWRYQSNEVLSISKSYTLRVRHSLLWRARELEAGIRDNLSRGREKLYLYSLSTGNFFLEKIQSERNKRRQNTDGLSAISEEILMRAFARIELNGKLINLYDPEHTLKRGYALLRQNGRVTSDIGNLKVGDQIEIDTERHRLKAGILENRIR